MCDECRYTSLSYRITLSHHSIPSLHHHTPEVSVLCLHGGVADGVVVPTRPPEGVVEPPAESAALVWGEDEEVADTTALVGGIRIETVIEKKAKKLIMGLVLIPGGVGGGEVIQDGDGGDRLRHVRSSSLSSFLTRESECELGSFVQQKVHYMIQLKTFLKKIQNCDGGKMNE